MSQGTGWLDRHVTGYAEWLIRWRWAVVAVSLVIALAAAAGGQFLGFSTNYRVFFSPQNPQLQAFESLQRIYVREDNISIVIRPHQGNVFQPGLLRDVRALTEDAWKVPYATRVDSLTNFQNSTAEGDDLAVRDLVPADSPLDAADLVRIREAALAEPLIRDRLIAPDARTLSVNITVTLPLKSETEVPESMAYARRLVDGFRQAHPEVRVALTGSVALNHAFSESAEHDIATLVPLMYGVLLLVMGVLLRSIAGTVATLLVIGLSAASAMGLAGWLGILLTPPSVTAPTIILTLAIADSIHILITMLQNMRRGADKRTALVESLRINFEPVFLTSLTTFIGFLSLNFSDAPPFRDLGNITAIGVAAAWIYSIGFLPALMAILPVRVKQRPIGYAGAMDRLADFVVGRRRAVLAVMVAVVAVLVALVPRIELNDQFVNYFDRSIPFRQDTDFAMEHLSGIYQAQWSLPAPGPGGISDPDYLARVEDFADWLRAHDIVVHVQTITDIFSRLNKNMHGDDPAWYRLPQERDLAAQYLLLFEMSLPYGLDLNNQINVDKSATRIVATLENITTNELRSLDDAAAVWLSENLPSAAGTTASGPFVMFAYIAKRNIEGMLTGTFAAFVLISLTLMAALRSVRLGLISLVPNLVPAFMAFGVWSVLVGQIGLASSVVTATSLGIIVDATVHFLSKYQRARRTSGASAEQAVRYAFSTVGTALWVTTAVLIAGFAVLSLSTFEINASLGQLTALTLFMGIVADFLLLPTLLLLLAGRGGRDSESTLPTVQQAAE
ncbi:RND transporter [Thalassobaculum fulvum]|uniref:RND transporter n=1 Tax=Thalassobaculum fulvum TaxID=1633335 RepID=A0A918XN42_9PROT|nr:MMPL family transporter [Thalassobaculum fulvum]GHD40900.1 RND transporter [Thalassobaculum fulvum]